MGRTPCCDKDGLKKGPWTSQEDQRLLDYINKHGYGNWRTLPKNAGLQRCGKSCRLRWTNYLRPDIKRGRFSYEEEETIIQLHCILGNKWSTIAARLPGRTDNEIKNYWNTHIRKRLLRMGIDPVTHSPRLDLLDLSPILGNSSLDNIHMNLDLINLDTSLFSTSNNPNPSCSLTYDFNPNTRIQNGMDPWVQTTQIEAPIVTPISNCTTMTTTATSTNFDQKFNQWSPSYGGINQTFMDHPESNNSNFGSITSGEGLQSYLKYEPSSVMSSTPSSSPTMDVRYCSENMFMINKFEIPDFLDVNQFI